MDTEKIDNWLEKDKHFTGRHDQKSHGRRGVKVAADKQQEYTKRLQAVRAEWAGERGNKIRARAEKTGTEVYQMRNGEFEIINDRYLKPGGSRMAGDFAGVENTLSEIETMAARK